MSPGRAVVQPTFLLRSRRRLQNGNVLTGKVFVIHLKDLGQFLQSIFGATASLLRRAGALQVKDIEATDQMPGRKLSLQSGHSSSHPFLTWMRAMNMVQ